MQQQYGLFDGILTLTKRYLSKDIATSVKTEAATDTFAIKLFIIQYT